MLIAPIVKNAFENAFLLLTERNSGDDDVYIASDPLLVCFTTFAAIHISMIVCRGYHL